MDNDVDWDRGLRVGGLSPEMPACKRSDVIARKPPELGRADMDAIDAVRLRYRPEKIITLFVGESAPHSGDFFYFGNTNMTRYMWRVIEPTAGSDGEFLDRFKARGWYLDDLVPIPIDKMNSRERRSCWRESAASLRDRIAEYQPRAIVTLLLAMHDVVERAALDAGSSAEVYAVPFPGMGHQTKFKNQLTALLPRLPSIPA